MMALIKDWLSENWLAAYGALVGTLALSITYLRYGLAKKASSANLTVSCKPNPHFQYQLSELRLLKGPDSPWRNRLPPANTKLLQNLFEITVVNKGSMPAYLADAGLISEDGEKKSASVEEDNRFLKIIDSNSNPVEPNASIRFWVYFHELDHSYTPHKCFVIDQTGREWIQPIRKSDAPMADFS